MHKIGKTVNLFGTKPINHKHCWPKINNPTILASGLMGYSAESMDRIANLALEQLFRSQWELSTCWLRKPNHCSNRIRVINAMGLPNTGIEKYVNEINMLKTVLQVPLIVSVFGYSADEYAIVAKKAAEAGADAIELIVSCPM
jgi:dihydroorotate dehydrogenase